MGVALSLPGAEYAERLEYAYSNARVKGMSANLLSQAQIDEMLGARSIAELMGMLNQTGYREDFVKPAVSYGGADLVEISLGRNLSRTFAKVVKFTPKKGRAVIGALLDRWDVHNVKTILLAKAQNQPRERVEPFLVMAGSLGEDKVKSLLRKDGVREVVDALRGTAYFAPLDKAFASYSESKELSVLLSALDAHFYSTLPDRIAATGGQEKIIEGLVKAEVDAKNVMNVLRAKKAGLKAERIAGMIFYGGNIPRGELQKLASADSVEDAAAMASSRFDLAKAMEQYKEDGSLVHFEVQLERRIVERGLRALRTSILSVGAIASFIFLKEEELGNIRKIVRGIEFGLPRDEIREMVVAIGG